MRIEQPQTREMALYAKLFGSGGQQQQSGHARGERRYCGVGRAGLRGTPGQMMSLVDDHEIPARGAGLRMALGRGNHKGQTGQHQLRRFKRIAFAGRGKLVADLLVQDRELEVEASQHLDQPLMHEIIRHHHQRAADAAR